MACYALVPAAGGGSRMGSACPKQYLPLAGQPLIRHALATLCAVPAIARVFVVLAPDDQQWPGCQYLAAKLRVLRRGGATRAKSVANGLRAMDGVSDDDWVLVHDAARACLSVAHVEQLIRDVGDDPVGGILAVPVADTLKRARHRRGEAMQHAGGGRVRPDGEEDPRHRSDAQQQHHGLGDDTFLPALEAEPLVGLALDVHGAGVDIEIGGNVGGHRRDVRRNFRRKCSGWCSRRAF